MIIFRPLIILLSTLASFSFLASASAQSSFIEGLISDRNAIDSSIMAVIFIGAFAFVMCTATWLLHAKKTLETQNREQALELADLNARYARAEALLDVPDQRIVIWEDQHELPLCIGALPPNSGAPFDPNRFIGFGTWMTPTSAQEFETAVRRLRSSAESFDFMVETQTNAHIEVQGRAFGSQAFVRFMALSDERTAFAALQKHHDRLVQTTNRMHSLLENLEAPIWLADNQGELTWVNQAYIKALDASSVEDVINNNLQLLDADKRNHIARYYKQNTETLSALFKERFPITISGDRRMADITISNDNTGMIGIAIDVHEIEEIQGNLRRTIESHSQTINELATAMAIFDEKRHLTFYNKEFENLWNLDSKFLQSEPDNGRFFDALREAGKLAEQPNWAKWRDGLLAIYEQTQPQEDWWHLPDGRTIRVVASPQKQGGVTWVFENITEQLEMESRYIALTQVQGETLDHLGEAIAVFAPNGHLKLSNPSFQNLWDLDDNEVVIDTPITKIAELSKNLFEDKKVWDRLITSITGVSDARKSISDRLSLTNGTILDYALVPLPNGQTMLSFADVTASVHLEDSLIERNEALEAAERLKNAFIEHVSYEFRAPLTNIKGFAEALKQNVFGALNDKQSEYIGFILQSSIVLHLLVDNLLDMATLDAGIMELDFQKIEINDVIETATNSVKEQLQEKNLTLELEDITPDGEDKQFFADVERVQQILFNILSNAIEFSPEQTAITLQSNANERHVFLRITDCGPGIPADQRRAIFKPFNSISHGSSRRGPGLGLTIARSLAELHDGEIYLDEAVTSGASFVCRFPKVPKVNTQLLIDAAQ